MGSDSTGEISLFDVALHEVGHTHDLGHSNIAASFMSAFYSYVSKGFQEDDYKALNQAWSKIKKHSNEPNE